ncbi:GIY-YIG nuclease superfamily [Macleaya cordata]|uniref:Structure-specific endonuclease subunit SLX1 homolog n=1 Tax=Macleaya cordata TaxID=56857 RepID=A0A200QQ91_MACCD|nr:GIY-YIG nuclease superfamily [Macleaya cordata]
MRKRKELAEERSETLISNTEGGSKEINKDEEEEEEEGEKGFFACYLLCSLCPRFKGHTYIGFTINPCRRIRQHNGEITSGAWRTKRKRPWEMILCIYGFPTNVSALQFEWAWQHPRESLAVRKAAASFKSFSGIARSIKLAYTMLTLPPWESLKLTVNFFSTKYTKHSAGCPSLPKQMKVQVCPMDELPCYIGVGRISDENEDHEEWGNEDDENGNVDRNLSESLMDISVDNTEAHQGTDHDWQRWIEDDSLIQPRDPPSPREEDNERPFRLVDSPWRPLSTSIASLVNIGGTVEYRDPFGLTKETGNMLGRAINQLHTTITAASGNQSPSRNSLLCPSEVGIRQLRDSLSPREEEDGSLPLCVVDSAAKTPFSSITGLANTVKVVEDRDSFGLIEKTGNKLWKASKQLATTITAASDNRSPSKNSLLCPLEVDFRQSIDLFSRREEECRPPMCLIDSPMETPHSSITASADRVVAVEDREPFGLVEESSNKMELPNKQQLRTPTAANNDQPPSSSNNNVHSSSEVEVINLLTPSSDCIIYSFHKKKRASLTRRDIIDLTKSPIFVQL